LTQGIVPALSEVPLMTVDEIVAYLDNVPLEHAAWWYIENTTRESSWRTEVLEHLHSRRSAEETRAAAAPSQWDEDPDFLVKDWQYEVANDDTRSGYRQWVASRRECEADLDQQDAAGAGRDTDPEAGP
jgi:hypothetical protein